TPTSSYFATLPPLSPSTTTSTTTSTAREGHEDEAEEYDYEENGSAFDSDLNADLNSFSGANGSQQSGCQLTRSASEEALPVRVHSLPFFSYLVTLIVAHNNTCSLSLPTVGFASFEPAIFAHSPATTTVATTNAPVPPASAASAAHQHSADAAEHGAPSSNWLAQQLLHPAETM